MIFYSVYYGQSFNIGSLARYTEHYAARCLFGRTAEEVIKTDRRNSRKYQQDENGRHVSIGISEYPAYCGTTPSNMWWIAQFEAVRVS